MKRRWLTLPVSAALLVGAVGCLWSAGLRGNFTPSMPWGLYRLVQGTAQRGDVVALCPPAPWGELGMQRGYTGAGLCPDGSRALLKVLAAVGGDRLETTAEGIAVNGVRQEGSLRQSRDRQGRAMDSCPLPDTVPAGAALVLTSYAWSFDGRYFGLVPLQSLQRVQPVLTFN